jgi:dCMP deaminase
MIPFEPVIVPNTWDKRFLRLALEVSTWSKDPNTKVGAVLVQDRNRVVSFGYNGFPRGIPDQPSLLNDRAYKNLVTVHAEVNALISAAGRLEPYGRLALYSTLPPCAQCMGALLQSGVKEFVSLYPEAEQWERWKESMLAARELAEQLHDDRPWLLVRKENLE